MTTGTPWRTSRRRRCSLQELDDGQMPQTMRGLADTVPGARFVGIDAAGHVPCYERPDVVNAALGEFLGTLGGAP